MSSVTVKVPGKIMLAGEYAVLEGAPCIASAVDTYMHVVASRTQAEYLVYSDLWGESWSLDAVPESFRSNPLIQTLRWCRENWQLPPFSLHLQSDFAISDGFGSSSALRLGVLFALYRLFEDMLPPLSLGDDLWRLPRYAWQMQLAEQDFASGYDILTQFHGGWLWIQPDLKQWPGELKQLAAAEAGRLAQYIHVFRGGQGAATKSVGKLTKDWLTAKQLWPTLIEQSKRLVAAFHRSLLEGEDSLDALILAVKEHRQLFAASPCYPKQLFSNLQSLEGHDKNWTYKTTGAGGEDAILLIGSAQALAPTFQALEKQGWSKLSHKLGAPGLLEQLTGSVPSNRHYSASHGEASL